MSLGLTILGEIFCVSDLFFGVGWGWGVGGVHTGCVFVAGIHQSRTWMSGSFVSVQWNACVHRLDHGLYSHPKEFWGYGVRAHVNSKGKIPSTEKNLPGGRSNPRRCIKQDSEPSTLPRSYSGPWCDQSCCLTKSQYADNGPTSPSTTPERKTPGRVAITVPILKSPLWPGGELNSTRGPQ